VQIAMLYFGTCHPDLHQALNAWRNILYDSDSGGQGTGLSAITWMS
jgi:D-arabinose 1-dehydrogenase-like Zn-dependent alcohol dehydrogenase